MDKTGKGKPEVDNQKEKIQGDGAQVQ